MKLIVINPKKDFTEQQVKMLETKGEAVFIETHEEYKEFKVLFEEGEKIVVLGPEVVDWEFSNETIDKIPDLKGICLPTTGFAYVDGTNLRTKNIPLTNVPKYATESVAEYAISLMLNITRKLPLVIKNDWKIDYDNQQGWEIKGKIMGIIGLGAIGSRIAELGQAMGMKVTYWSRKSRNDNYDYMELDEVLKNSDYVFPALAKNDKTHNLLSKEKLDLMKPNAFLVSITGEDIFDFEHAVKMVNSGALAGVAMEDEKRNSTNFDGNVWITPPIAWFTQEAFDEDMRIWVDTVVSVIEGNPINLVN